MKLKQKKNENAITLIALVVTIVVLLILAGVSISMLTGENGIITQAQEAKLETRGGTVEERINVWKTEVISSNFVNTEYDSEEIMLNKLVTEELVKEKEIDRTEKTITIGKRIIHYNINSEEKNAIKIKVNTGDDGRVVLPIPYSNCTVNWGDGKSEVVAKKDEEYIKLASIYKSDIKVALWSWRCEHYYEELNVEKIVTIYGELYELDSANCQVIDPGGSPGANLWSDYRDKLIEVVQWGDGTLKSVNLSGCYNLKKIASPTKNSFVNLNADGFEGAFEGCESLEQIPENLFSNCPNVTSFYETFSDCTSLTEIPGDLFTNCPNVTSFANTFFNCTSLAGTAPELWNMGTNSEENGYQGVPDGCNCFFSCTDLSNYEIIPEYWKNIK